MAAANSVDVLLLGSGWTGSFLRPLLRERGVSHAYTTRDGKDGSIPFSFDPSRDDDGDRASFAALPQARTIVIVFPVYVEGGYDRLLRGYNDTHSHLNHKIRWIQLGSTGSYDGGPTFAGGTIEKSLSSADTRRPVYVDRHSPINLENDRTKCEQELLKANSKENATLVLHLCGLYGGTRSIRRYVGRIAGTKEQLAAKGSVHMVHGIDVARAILAVHDRGVVEDDRQYDDKSMYGQRWIVTDQRVYDWWDLASKWGIAGEEGRGKPMTGPQAQWVTELMLEHGIKVLPRSPEQLGRAMTSLDFWETVKISPIMGGQLD